MEKKNKPNNIKPTNVKLGQRWMYVVLGIMIMLCLGTVYSWSVFRHHVEELYQVGNTQSGFPYMISLAFYAFFMFLTGKYVDRYSPKLITSFGGILVAIGWLLSAYAPNIYILSITYGMIIGGGVGIAYGAPMAVVAKWFPEKKGFAVGLILAGFGLSPLITAPVATHLIETYGLISTFKLLGIVFGVIIPLLSFTLKYPSHDDDKYLKGLSNTQSKSLNDINTSHMIKSKSFKGLYLNFVIGTMIGLMLVGLTSTIGIGLIGLPSKTVALCISVFAIFNGVSRPLFGWMTDKLSPKKAMLVSYTLIMVAGLLMLMANEGDLVLFVIAFSIFWFNLGGWLAIAPTSTINIYGAKYYSQNYGVVFTAYGIGAILGVLASGLLLDFHSYHAIFYLVIVLSVIGIVLSRKMLGSN